MSTVRVNEIEMYYEVHGTGRPLVAVLGLGGDVTQYTGVIKRLSKHYRVIAFDNRGSGRTSAPESPYSMEMMANDTFGLMDALQLERATVLGHSMGGRVALAMALDHPERIDRLILVSTGPHRFSQLRVSLPMLLVLPFRKLPPFRSRYRQSRAAFVRQRLATFDFDVGNRLSEIKLTTLIMHGMRDRTALYANAVEMHREIVNSELVTFNGGHLFFMLGERRRFLTELMQFLDS